MTTDFSTHEMRAPRRTVVQIQQSDNFSLSASPKPRMVTGYTFSMSESAHLTRRSSSPPLPPPPPILHDRTPELSPSSTLTKPKRLITSPAVVNNNKSNGRQTQLIPSSGRFVINSDGMKNSEKPNDKHKDIFRKKEKDQKEKQKYRESDPIYNSSKSRLIFSSQVYLIFHISITISLIGYKEYENNNDHYMSYELTIFVYFAYLLSLSIIFLLLMRCRNSESSGIGIGFGIKQIHCEHTAILIGVTSLGVIQLIQIGLEVAQCIENESVVLPVLHFIFTLFLIHFLLTQVIQDKHIGFSNIALSHLLSTQISLWIINFDSRFESRFLNTCDKNLTSITSKISTKNMFLPTSIANLIIPIIHHYKLLTIFILVTIWFTNNQSKIDFIRAKLFDEEALKTTFLSTKPSSIKGFFIGLLILSTAIIALLLEDQFIQIITHISIQGISGIVAVIGLIIRRKRHLNYKCQINLLDYHFIIYVTLFAAFISGLTDILLNSKPKHINIEILSNGLILMIQMTLQSFLMRSQGRKFVNMSQVFALLVLSNLSLWILEISEMAIIMAKVNNIINLSILLSLFVSLNRFYSSLVFFQFWKTKSY